LPWSRRPTPDGEAMVARAGVDRRIVRFATIEGDLA
jgi:hypothetical protein